MATAPAIRRSLYKSPIIASGATLLELIIVFFIIGVMISMLLPALQAARAKADSTACQNNVRQVGMALARAMEARRRFPRPHEWTIECLPYMEERPLYDHIVANGISEGAGYVRPKLMGCRAQPEVSSTVPNVEVCHYVLVVDRPNGVDQRENFYWDIQDRPPLADDESLEPWYVGPEISFAERHRIVSSVAGPHQAGVYYTQGGQTLGGD